MRETVVKFSVRVPMERPGVKSSRELDALLKQWQADEGVGEVTVRWTSVPQDTTRGYVELSVRLVATDCKGLQKLYAKLSSQAHTAPQQLAGRECILTEMFD